jgi:ATP-dependent RNA helicase DeaD
VPRAAAARFAESLKRTQGDDPETEDGIIIQQVEGKPREAAKQNRRDEGRSPERREAPPQQRQRLAPKYGAEPTPRDGPPRGPKAFGAKAGTFRGKPGDKRPGAGKPFKGKPKGRP